MECVRAANHSVTTRRVYRSTAAPMFGTAHQALAELSYHTRHMFKRFVESSGFRLTRGRLGTVTLKSPTV